ncbi:MAG TPA: YbaB/EbfC family nucleoid-associated protein [Firmicutes bacterium]|nr:YbaB/EbfC family nucleoid-associated protein [Bacillota bacterium]
MGQDFGKFISEFQHMQGRAGEIQAGLKSKTVEGYAGGGLVKAVANGFGEITSIEFDDKLISRENLPMLRTLIVGAVNDAIARSRNIAVSEVLNALGGPMKQES